MDRQSDCSFKLAPKKARQGRTHTFLLNLFLCAIFHKLNSAYLCRGVAGGEGGGGLECPWTPLGRPSFEETTYNIQVARTPWQYLGCKSHCWKAHFLKLCLLVKYFRQRLLSLVNMTLHAAIVRLRPLMHEGEQRYKPYIVGDPRMVTPPLKNPGYAPAMPFRKLIPSFTLTPSKPCLHTLMQTHLSANQSAPTFLVT